MEIEGFVWDQANEHKVQAHNLTADDVDAVLLGKVATFKNRSGRAGVRLLVGRNENGRYITVIIQPDPGAAGLWRPVTAWYSKQGEITRARNQGV